MKPNADASFYERVLDHMRTPVLVVSLAGEITYANRALTTLAGASLNDDVNLLDFVHPDDHDWVVNAFGDAGTYANAARDAVTVDGFATEMWAPIPFRMIDVDGTIIPIELVGHSAAGDPAINGIIYEVRVAHTQELMHRVLTGLAEREPVESLLRLVIETISTPPLELDAIVLEAQPDGSFESVVSTSYQLSMALGGSRAIVPWNAPINEPSFVDVTSMPGAIGEQLREAGYVDLWHIAVESGMASFGDSYRLLCCDKNHQEPNIGAPIRLAQAAELAAVIMLRSQTDALLQHSATHDQLTGLRNRSGFYGDVLDSMGTHPIAILYIDIDGLKAVNDIHGHATGDMVLQRCADRLRSATRLGDHTARLGGDEFAAVIQAEGEDGEIDIERIQRVVARILEAISQPIQEGPLRVEVSASIGVAVAERPRDIDDLLAAADHAMYEAKRSGGNDMAVADGNGGTVADQWDDPDIEPLSA